MDNIGSSTSSSNDAVAASAAAAAAAADSQQPQRTANKRATLNIDSALFLQSQAIDVQQPSVNNPSFQAHQQRLAATQADNKNISVDYIDCVSNNDLSALPAARRTSHAAAGLRKHLRFGGPSNRIGTATHRQFNAAQSNGTDFQQHQQLSNLDNPQLQPATSSSSNNDGQQQSVLFPILVQEVKRRTYFIGSVPQDSLLGSDELYKCFPSGKVNIFVCTWNQNRKRAPLNINELLLPDRLVYMPDIYAIGVQEAFSAQAEYLRDWDVQLQTNLGSSHVLLHSASLGVLHLSIFIRRDLIWFCSTPEESLYNSRTPPTNLIKTKGAVSIAFRFFGTSLMFINCHFPPHENRLQSRIDEYVKIINSIDLPKNLKLLKPRYLSNDSTARFDCVFFLGDLNFRLKQRSFDETIAILEEIFQQKEPSYEALTQTDELLSTLEAGTAFKGFDESVIKFPPTYKFLAQTNKYDRQSRRVPSYTDRILFRSKRQGHIQCLIYDWLPNLLSSDHKPVYCLFNALIRPGRDQTNLIPTLNAGLFKRGVYLEALKRRSQQANCSSENDVGSNICSLI